MQTKKSGEQRSQEKPNLIRERMRSSAIKFLSMITDCGLNGEHVICLEVYTKSQLLQFELPPVEIRLK